jgi:F1F0 ATPase subunit 2
MEIEGSTRIVTAALAGGLIGILYFGGLWLTIGRMQRTKRPGLLLLASFIGRSGLALGGFYLVSGGELARLAACLGAFFLTRWLFIKKLQPEPKSHPDMLSQAD